MKYFKRSHDPEVDAGIEFLNNLQAENGMRLVKNNCIQTLEMVEGECTTRCLEHIDKIYAAAYTTFTAGSVTDKHFHSIHANTKEPIREHVIIIKGKMVMKFFDKEGKFTHKKTLKRNDYINISSMQQHVACFPKYTELIAITIPNDINFPKNE